MAANHNAVKNVAGNTPISASAYSTVFAGTPFPTCQLIIANGTDQAVTLAVGAAGNELDIVAVAAGTTQYVSLYLSLIPVGSRLSAQAVGTATTSGQFVVSVLE